MATYAFLSDQWIIETRALREQYRDQTLAAAVTPVRVNMIVTEMPAEVAGGEKMLAHLDTSSGEPELDLGHLDAAEVTVTADYDLIRAIFVNGDFGKAMEGMQLGRIKVDGDMFKLMALASVNANPGAYALAKAIQAITA